MEMCVFFFFISLAHFSFRVSVFMEFPFLLVTRRCRVSLNMWGFRVFVDIAVVVGGIVV